MNFVMPRIITVTPNTAIDQVITLKQLKLGETLLATSNVQFAAGKGVNVAKTVAALGVPVCTLGFVGRANQHAFTDFDNELMQPNFLSVAGSTRTNLTLISSDTETHIRTAGYQVTVAECEQLCQQLIAQLQAGDVLVLSGSLPPGAPVDFYAQLLSACHAKGAYSLLDTSGLSLSTALFANPCLIKPNQQELADLVGQELHTETALLAAARSVLNQGVQVVVVSSGAGGAILVTQQQAWRAYFTGQANTLLSSVGCGDALVGGLAVGYLQGLSLTDSLHQGIACATANLYSIEPGHFSYQLFQTLHKQVTLQVCATF